jgi:hypothetical protein
MVKRGRRKRLDPSLAAKYHRVALALGNSLSPTLFAPQELASATQRR